MPTKIIIFLSIALILYLFDWFLNNDDENTIYVSSNDIDFLVSTWNDQMQRPPNEEELKSQLPSKEELVKKVKDALHASKIISYAGVLA